MSNEAESVLTRHLDAGENLVWTGMPRQGLLLRPSDLFLIPFSLVWAGFLGFAIFDGVGTGTPGQLLTLVLVGIPFLAFSLYFVVGRFFADAALRARTHYGITRQRILISKGLFSKTLISLPLANLSGLSLRERADGSGSIYFGEAPSVWTDTGTGLPLADKHIPPSFDLIENAKQAYDVIRQTQKSVLK